MTQVNAIMLLLVIHYVADFACQHPWMANNKSKSMKPLLAHVLVYGSILGTGVFFLYGYSAALAAFILINTVSHAVVDYNTSRVSSKLFAAKKNYRAFNIIGIDQLIHQVILIYSTNLFY